MCSNGTDIKIIQTKDGHPFSNLPQSSGNSKSLPDSVELSSEKNTINIFENATIDAGEGDTITCMLLSPDGGKLVVALKSLQLRLYEWPSQKVTLTFRCLHKTPIGCLAWDVSSTLLATGAADGSCRVWDTQRNVCTHVIKGVFGVFTSLLFHTDLHTNPLLYAGVNHSIHAWKLNHDCSNEIILNDSESHHLTVTCLLISTDGKQLISSGLDKVAIVWDAVTMHQIKVVVVGQAVSGAVLLPTKSNETGLHVLLGGETGYLSIWHLNECKEVFRTEHSLVKPPEDEKDSGVLAIKSIVHNEASDSIILNSYDNNLIFLNTETLKPTKMLCGHNEEILSVIIACTPGQDDSRPLLIVASNSPEIRVYEMDSLNCQLLRGHTAIVLSLARHPSQMDTFASCSHDFSIRLWNTTPCGSAVCVAVGIGHSQSVASICFGTNYLYSCAQDQCVKLWDDPLSFSREQQDISDILGVRQPVQCDTELNCKSTITSHEKDINCIAVSRKDRYVATGSRDKTIKLWNGSNLSAVATLTGHRKGIWCVQFSPVDKLLASGSSDGTIALWSLDTFNIVSVSIDFPHLASQLWCVLLGSEFRELVMFTFLFKVFPDVFFWSFLLRTQFCSLFKSFFTSIS